jgi:hypothetical protein
MVRSQVLAALDGQKVSWFHFKAIIIAGMCYHRRATNGVCAAVDWYAELGSLEKLHSIKRVPYWCRSGVMVIV